MEQRSEPLTALLATAWRGLGRSLAATVGCSTALQGDRRSGVDLLIEAADDAVFLAEIS
jgi:predicted protein tyrosine phosphatase